MVSVGSREWVIIDHSLIKLSNWNEVRREESVSLFHLSRQDGVQDTLKARVTQIADKNDRFEILSAILPRVPLNGN